METIRVIEKIKYLPKHALPPPLADLPNATRCRQTEISTNTHILILHVPRKMSNSTYPVNFSCTKIKHIRRTVSFRRVSALRDAVIRESLC